MGVFRVQAFLYGFGKASSLGLRVLGEAGFRLFGVLWSSVSSGFRVCGRACTSLCKNGV